jgi:hypothetical protein
MALVKFGVVVVGARGTIGGLKFSANRGGPYASQWSKGSNPKSPTQSDQRGLFGTIASEWRDLSQAQRDDWDDYADDAPQEKFNSLGESYFVSGFNWFVAINQNLTAAGEATRVDAPTLTRPLATVIQNVNVNTPFPSGAASVRYDTSDPDLPANHVVWARIVDSQGVGTVPSKLPFMVVGVPGGTRFLSITDPLLEKFGTIESTQRILVSSVIQDAHGQRGPEDTNIADPI